MNMYEELVWGLEQVKVSRAEYLTDEHWAVQVAALEGALAAFQRVWEICHETTEREPALRHFPDFQRDFQQDFDEIRTLVKPFIKPEEV